MIEIVDVEQKEVTDQESIEAVNKIHKYCKNKCCDECAIGQVCDIGFRRMPIGWPEVEVPGD